MTQDVESWLPIAAYPGYEVSDQGRARNSTTGRILTAHPNEKGYLRVDVRDKRLRVHRLVLEAFVGPCPPGHQCRHLDGDNRNNHLSNLAWGTCTENHADKIAQGTARLGSLKSGNTRRRVKDPATVRLMRDAAELGCTTQAIGDFLGVNRGTVSDVIHGRYGYDKIT